MKVLRTIILNVSLLLPFVWAAGQSVGTETVHIKVGRKMVRSLRPAPPNGRTTHATTGIQAFDLINQKYQVKSFQRIFRPSPKFEQAHKKFDLDLWYEMTVASGVANQMMVDYQATYGIETVEKAIPCELEVEGSEQLPSDPSFSTQWHYRNTGQTGGTAGADIKLAQAWPLETGSSDVVVAIIDMGVDFNHPDLSATQWINTNEIPDNGIDDDNNGYIDDINGFGFGDGSGEIRPGSHGTHVAGTVGAVSNNGIGVAGVAGGFDATGGVRLMSCAVFGRFANGGFADAFVYAADHGAVIAQNSWTGGSSAIEAAIDYFIARAGLDNSSENFANNIQTGPMAGGIVVFAAGNSNTSSTNLGYPASYPKTIAVASTDDEDIKSSFSNFGSWVDVAAPGTNVFSTVIAGNYGFLSGTSMACPHVSGVAALIVSKFKNGITPDEVRQRLIETSDNINYKNPSHVGLLGRGRLNAFNALAENTGVALPPIDDLSITSLGATSATLTWTSPTSPNHSFPTGYEIRYSPLPLNDANFENATLVATSPFPAPSGTKETFVITNLPAEPKHYFGIKSIDFFGNVSSLSNIIATSQLNQPVMHVSGSPIQLTLHTGQTQVNELQIANSGVGNLLVEITSELPASESIARFASKGVAPFHDPYPSLQKKRSAAGYLKNSKLPMVSSSSGFEVYGVDYETGQCVKMDAATGGVTDIISLPVAPSGGPDGLALNGTHLFYINSSHSNIVYKINVQTQVTEDQMTLPPNLSHVDGLAHSGKFLYAVDYMTGEIFEIDFDAHTIGNTFQLNMPIGGGFTYGGSRGTFFVSDFQKRVHEIDLYRSKKILTIEVESSIYGLAYSEANKKLVVATGEQLKVFDPDTGTEERHFDNLPLSALAADEIGIPDWLQYPTTHTIPADQSRMVTITVNTNELAVGTYSKNLVLQSNDVEKAHTLIPVSITVTSAPSLSLSTPSIDAGLIYTNETYSFTTQVRNNGTETLSVADIEFTQPDLTLSSTSFVLAPGEYQNIDITFVPTVAGIVETNFVIVSNDPDTPQLPIVFTADVKAPPSLVNNTNALNFQLFTGESKSLPIDIQNLGGSALTYSSNTHNVLPMPAANSELTSPKIGYVFENGYTLLAKLAGKGMVPQLLSSPLNNESLAEFKIILFDETISTLSSGDINVLGHWVTHGGLLVLASDDLSSFANINALVGDYDGSIQESTVFSETITEINDHPPLANITAIAWPDAHAFISVGDPSHVLFEDSQHRAQGVWLPAELGKIVVLANSVFSDTEMLQAQNSLFAEQLFEWLLLPAGWINIPEPTGTITDGESGEIEVSVNALHLPQGIYSASIKINSNDPAREVLLVPVQMEVTNAPDILPSAPGVLLPDTFIGGESSVAFSITNFGTEVLTITDIESNNSEFSIESFPSSLQPDEVVTLTALFHPLATGARNGQWIIHSNDPDEEFLTISFSGEGTPPPVIEVATFAMKEFMPNANGIFSLPILNSGNSNLTWRVDAIDFVAPGAGWLRGVSNTSEVLLPGQRDAIALPLNTDGLALGDYTALVTILSNDPLASETIITLKLAVMPYEDPTVISTIDDQQMDVEDLRHWSLNEFFTDPDNQALSYSVKIETDIAETIITGNELSIRALNTGKTDVTVTANDNFGGRAQFSFELHVKDKNEPPFLVAPLSDLAIAVNSKSELSLPAAFQDPNNDSLTFTFEVADPTVTSATFDEAKLEITGLHTGHTLITITATDAAGLSAMGELAIVVYKPNSSPTLTEPLSDQRVELGYETLLLDLTHHFSDTPDDSLTYAFSIAEDIAELDFTADGKLEIIPVVVGSSMIELAATDRHHSEVRSTFQLSTFTNQSPVVLNIETVELTLETGRMKLPLSKLFNDPDEDQLTYQVTNASSAVLSAQLKGDTLLLEPLMTGEVNIGLSATDKRNNTAETSLHARVSTNTGLMEDKFALRVFPNPFSDQLIIRYQLELPTYLVIQITTVTGESVLSHALFQEKTGVSEFGWNTRSLVPGIYLIHFTANGIVRHFKVVKP